MAKIVFNDVNNSVKEVKIKNGHTILRAAKQGRFPLRHKCGGRASCTTCKVYIENQENTSGIAEIEKRRLGDVNIQEGMRLSCQTKVYGTVSVKVPEDPYKARIRQLLNQQKSEFDI